MILSTKCWTMAIHWNSNEWDNTISSDSNIYYNVSAENVSAWCMPYKYTNSNSVIATTLTHVVSGV